MPEISKKIYFYIQTHTSFLDILHYHKLYLVQMEAVISGNKKTNP